MLFYILFVIKFFFIIHKNYLKKAYCILYYLYYISNGAMELNINDINIFLENIETSIYSWNFFSDFNKMDSNAKKYEKELKILQQLLKIKEDKIDQKLLSILYTNKIKQALLFLIALRPKQIKELNILINNKSYNYYNIFTCKETLNNHEEILFLEFFHKSGLRNFFLTSDINSLVDYCKGVEIGMDTNSRKNRTGSIMEQLCEEIIKKICLNNNWSYLSQASAKKIKKEWDIDVHIGDIDRRFDFIIKDSFNKLSIIEVNFYNSVGSKIKATAKEYINLNTMLKDKMDFYWITDGKGWFKCRSILAEIPSELNILTIKNLSNGLFEGMMNNKIKKIAI